MRASGGEGHPAGVELMMKAGTSGLFVLDAEGDMVMILSKIRAVARAPRAAGTGWGTSHDRSISPNPSVCSA
jgi:hypothetical protein